jgi:hypothetical protein
MGMILSPEVASWMREEPNTLALPLSRMGRRVGALGSF